MKAVETPDALRSFPKASKDEQLRRARAVLMAARKLYRAKFGPLWDCIREAGGGTLEGYYAERLMKAFTWSVSLADWEEHPATRRADVYRAVDACIRRSSALKGGWLVSVGAPKPARRMSMPPRFADAKKRTEPESGGAA